MIDANLRVRGLTVGYAADGGWVRAVDDVSFDLQPGERLGIVGESGSGKSTLALALLGLLPPWAKRLDGSVELDGTDVTALPPGRLRELRGGKAGMVFQDPLRSFDPLRTIGYHMREGMRAHGTRGRSATERATRALRSVGMPAPESQLRRRPHELSGGMQQRSLIALGLQNDPRLLVADEPTTALDVTIQAQIVELFETIGAPGPWQDTSLILVSHNLGLVRRLCTRVAVMYAGRIVEDAPAEEFFAAPRHPYGRALLAAMPKLEGPRGTVLTIPGSPPDLAALPSGCSFAPRCSFRLERCEVSPPPVEDAAPGRLVACYVGARAPLADQPEHAPAEARPAIPILAPPAAVEDAPIVTLRSVEKRYRVRAGTSPWGRRVDLAAVAGVDLDLYAGETLALVGESGSGKSTLARLVLGLTTPTAGEVRVEGDDPALPRSAVRKRQRVQAVFQDPHGSLDPRMTVADAIVEPLRNLGRGRSERRLRLAEVLDEVRLGSSYASRYPHELSGGQAQRVAIARALAADPRIVILDEPTASLDVSIQTHIVALLRDLQERHGLTYLFVSHDLAAVRELATRVAVMYLGRVVELAPADTFFDRPLHPYSTALLSAIPRADVPPSEHRRIVLNGEPPSPLDVPPGCPFHPRCPAATDHCRAVVPPLAPEAGALVACHYPGVLDAVRNDAPASAAAS